MLTATKEPLSPSIIVKEKRRRQEGNNTTLGDPDRWISQLRQCKKLSYPELVCMCQMLIEILIEEGTVQSIGAPVTICGDVHGQFYDILELFRTGGEVPDTNYLFLGDYVDRGYHSVETCSLLFALKVRYPGRVTLLRGNHESRQITQVYGFYDECIARYLREGADVWRLFTEVFDYLPLAAVVGGSIFCVHGGLSPDIHTIEQMQTLQRITEIPHEGPICDMMWSDPEEIEEWSCCPRGAGWLFGTKVVDRFCYTNNMELICRAHQLCQDGYRYNFPNQTNMLTVWSAPNYCYRCANLACVFEVDSNLNRTFKIFDESPLNQELVIAPRKTAAPYFL